MEHREIICHAKCKHQNSDRHECTLNPYVFDLVIDEDGKCHMYEKRRPQ